MRLFKLTLTSCTLDERLALQLQHNLVLQDRCTRWRRGRPQALEGSVFDPGPQYGMMIGDLTAERSRECA